jgi:hypothetical protein
MSSSTTAAATAAPTTAAATAAPTTAAATAAPTTAATTTAATTETTAAATGTPTETTAAATTAVTGQYGMLLLVFIVIFVIVAIYCLIKSLMCFGKSGSTAEKIIGLLIAFFTGPFYLLYLNFNEGYCNNEEPKVLSPSPQMVGGRRRK